MENSQNGCKILTGEEAMNMFQSEDKIKRNQEDMRIALNIWTHLMITGKATIILNPHYVMLHPEEKHKQVFEWGRWATLDLIE